MSHAIERVWKANGLGARLLSPLSWIFGGLTGLRNALFALGLRKQHRLGAPTISVGNLSVGGTGKTPVAAWVAAELRRLGARPAVLLRGYGADEPLVHSRLNPEVPVIADADRRRGAQRALAAGATVLVLDDAFQHRQVARDVDLVLVAAEQGGMRRVLPAGPLRESPRNLRRASLLAVTRKSASHAAAEQVAADWTSFAGAPPTAILRLGPGDLRPVRDGSGLEPQPLGALAGQRVLAVSGIGDPAAFEAQLADLGAEVSGVRYPDHHRFVADDVAQILRRAESMAFVVCTLKDAVKLGLLWPRQAPPLWYLSQAVEVERGADALVQALRRLVPDGLP